LVQIAYIKAFQQIKYMDNGISYLIVLLLNTVINIRFFGGMPDIANGFTQFSLGKLFPVFFPGSHCHPSFIDTEQKA
ncbi:MAG: hypothetical protein PHQ41_08965, partial [Candidatus Cloacimonetes bacterium]|nr:hypothetical protein [Candidatus Cloacimonadota bacterium]